jgi:hypothetical protein
MALEYLKVLLSGPPVAGTITIVCLCLFRGEIRSLIARVGRIRFPGGEVFTSQQERTQADIAPKQELPAVPRGEQPQLPATITLTPQEAEQIGHLLQSERANAYLWEYRYLNLFLARSTQLVLDWFGTLQQPMSMHLVDSYLLPLVPSAQERAAIITALESHHLIFLTPANLVEISPKGREYLQWRGPLPPSPTT